MGKRIRTIIVEDEKKPLEVLQSMLAEHCPEIEIIATADTVSSAEKAILEHEPDLIFLDIKLKNSTGFDLLERFEDINFLIIFTTAFNNFALKAFEFSALDYLLKPIETKALQRAYKKLMGQLKSTVNSEQYNLLKEMVNGSAKEQRIALPATDGYIFIELRDIVRCEASGHYTYFYLQDGVKLIVSRILKEYEELLREHNFYRIHQSHLINFKHLKKYVRVGGNHVIMADGSSLPVSKRRRDDFQDKLGGLLN